MPKIPYSKRKDGRYYKQISIGYNKEGKRKFKTLYDRDWRRLDRKVRQFKVDLENGKYIAEDITLSECIQLWWKMRIDISGATKYTYKSTLAHVAVLEGRKMKDIRPMDIQMIYNELYQKGYVSVLSSLPPLVNSIFEFAVDNHFLLYNVAKKIKVPKLKGKKRRALTLFEKEAVNKAFSDFNLFEQALVGLLRYTGMRRGEVLVLKVSDINFEKRYIFVRRTLSKDENGKVFEKPLPKTEAGIRQIPLLPRLAEILRKYIDENDFSDGYLFLTRNDTFFDSSGFQYRWRKILAKINAYMPPEISTDVSPHYFRHNFATELIYADVPIKSVQRIMGHESIKVTLDIYAEAVVDIDDTIEKFTLHLDQQMNDFSGNQNVCQMSVS